MALDKLKKSKAAYLTIADTQATKNSQGIIKKVKSQIKALERLGYIMDFFHFHDDKPSKNNIKVNAYKKKGMLSKFKGDTILYNYLLGEDKMNAYRFIYIRYPKSSPPFINFLRKIKKQNPNIKIIIEIPTYPYEKQWITFKAKLNQQVDYYYRKKLRKYVDRIVTFYGQDSIFNIKTIQIGNGIDTSKTDIIKRLPAENTKVIRLIGVATLKFYHGYDRVIMGLANNKTDYKIIFNIVGEGPELESLKILVSENNLSDNVTFHGFQYGKELESRIASADIAVGTLAWHRAGSNRDSALKTREYCAYGIPFIISSEDPDFPKKFPYMLKLKTDDEPMHINALINFYNSFITKENYQEKMHEYAVSNLDWNVKMQNVTKYVKEQV